MPRRRPPTAPRVRPRVRARSLPWVASLLALLAAVVTASSTAVAPAASSTTVVSATVPSATNLATSPQCQPFASGSTDLGTVLPGSGAVSSASCTVTFGSSNDTARLRLTQSDGRGAAMYATGSTALDATWPGSGRNVADFVPGITDQLDHVAVLPDDSVLLAGLVVNLGQAYFTVVKYTAAGAVDTTFGMSGMATLAVPGTQYGFGDILVRPDGRILLVGWGESGSTQLTLVQFLANGTPDGAFGTGASTYVQVGNAAATFDEAWVGGAVLADGSVLVGGKARMSGARWDFVTAKVKPDGSGLDTTYGGGDGIGQATGDTVGVNAYSVTVESSGAALVSGSSYRSGNLDGNVARFTAAGTADTAFGGGGDGVLVVRWDAAQTDHATRTLVDPSGGWLVGGMTYESGTTWRVSIARVLPAGTLDPAFGTSGKRVLTTYATGLQAYEWEAVGDGKLLAIGNRFSPGGTFVSRLNADGTTDTTFGTNGVLVLSTTDPTAPAAAWQSDGKLVIAGTSSVADSVNYRIGATTIPQYTTTTADWSSPATASLFGACIAGATNASVTAPWVVDGDGSCSPIATDPWQPVAAASGDATASLATTLSNVTNATVSLRFGFRAGSGLTPGRYIAPLTLTVVAPQ